MNSNLLSDINASQLDQIYSTRVYSIFTMLAGMLLLYVLMSGYSRYPLEYWLGYMLVIDVYRIYTLWLYRHHKENHNVDYALSLKHIIAGTVLSGVGWGSIAVILYPYLDHFNQVVFLAVIIGISTGSTTTLAYIREVAVLFVTLVLVPFIITLTVLVSNMMILGVILAVYLLFLYKNISVFYRNNRNLLILELHAHEREKELEIQRERAVSANAAKSAFLANISHELRTPMHAILGFSELGINKIDRVPKEKLVTYYTRIQESGQRLLALLNNLLDISKFEAGRMTLEMGQQDLRESIDIVSEELAPLFVERSQNIELVIKGNSVAMYDNEKIIRVIRNLLSNAIRFSPRGSSISVSVEDAQLASGSGYIEAVSLSVCDQGPGIPDDELEDIFDKFVQSSKNESSGGTGLGLSICNEIITMHKGKITAHNASEGGALFRFIIPRQLAENTVQ